MYLNNFADFDIANNGDGCAENGIKMEMTSYQKGDGFNKYCIKDMVRELLVNEIDITKTLQELAGYRSFLLLTLHCNSYMFTKRQFAAAVTDLNARNCCKEILWVECL